MALTIYDLVEGFGPFTCDSFRDFSDDYYANLKTEIGTGKLDLEFRLPAECDECRVYEDTDDQPHIAKLSISGHKNGKYDVCLSQSVHYRGRSNGFKQLASGETISFNDWSGLVAFLKSLSYKDEETKASSSVEDITDFSDLFIPDMQVTPYSYEYLRDKIHERIMGQEFAVDAISYQVALFLQKKKPKRPPSFLCYGRPGTGKSECAKAVADILAQHPQTPYSTVWVDLNTFTERHSVYRLTGAPPGYVGYDDKPVFEAVIDNPYTVFIFDELDKANPEVLKVFMGVIEAGKLASRKEVKIKDKGKVREYDFKHCIFFFTSNYDLSGRNSSGKIGFSVDVGDNNSVAANFTKETAQEEPPLPQRIYTQTERARKAFTKEPGALQEIASRFTCFLEFEPLKDDAKIRILAKQIVETALEYDVRLARITPKIMQEVINAATAEESLTVRSFKAVIEGYLSFEFAEAQARHEDYNGEYILEGNLKQPVLTPVDFA